MEELHMKLNPKVYKQLTNEPFQTQTINGKLVEFHYMNDTQFLLQFASRGRFAVWTSDGNNYKVLIEKKYHEALNDFYQPEVNTIWLKFLERVSAISKKINTFFIIPTLILYVIIAGVATVVYPDNTLEILVFMIVLVIISNMIQGRIINKKVRAENMIAQDKIRAFMGNEKFEGLVKSQEEHYQEYFKFDEPVEEVEVDKIEDKEVEQSEDNDGTEGN
jgi:hypothetical protein